MARKKIVAGNWKMNMTPSPVSYTHLDVYKRQTQGIVYTQFYLIYYNCAVFTKMPGRE